MTQRFARLAIACGLFLTLGCATNLGTGNTVIRQLQSAYPITVGKLIDAQMDTRHRLRVYLQVCQDTGPGGMVCSEDDLRVLALVEADKKSLLERISENYLNDGRDKPVYVYGPLCEGFEEMIVVPRCQTALALGIWDPRLRDYVMYSTRHGSGSMVESDGFSTFLDVTGRAAGIIKKAAK